MAAPYKTPGVYVEEISTLPASVAQVATAIPAFIGYTEKAVRDGQDLSFKPIRITTLLEYKELFGGPKRVEIDVRTTPTLSAHVHEEPKHFMFHNMEIYFNNGGGPCYIVSIGDYSGVPAKADFEKGIDKVALEDEPTLFVFSEAVSLGSDYFGLCTRVLTQCNNLQDRFGIFDVQNEDDDPFGFDFRGGIGTEYLKYGAAYYPYLETSLNYAYEDSDVSLHEDHTFSTSGSNGLTFSSPTHGMKVKVVENTVDATIKFSFNKKVLTISVVKGANAPTAAQLVAAWDLVAEKNNLSIVVKGNGSDAVALTTTDYALVAPAGSVTLDSKKTSDTALYNEIKAEINKLRITLPPSGAIAGVYARVDSNRGVWKAPANVSLNNVVKPSIKISHLDQENLNVHTTGKSINAIRSFTGKGVMVWGARTLAGNDNEWRYIPVRRLFNMVEESVKKATEFVVFEPNDANTWVRTKAMIENYLTGLWRAGALAGAKPDQAFFVNVGLGTTMTPQDILEGRMNIEIGMAAVRPAEFIILKFSHKLQEA
ncbi:MAG: phage tail sheath C-terminal domain-containing protein [Reichenbachiella sp.]|uniref:phage tail sheath family protein n=1 Tax=Reichenbachiella sp. TaxID=2184521 RepID=UPI0032652A6B